MPKRIRTPPPAEDEPRYLTVVHPYAISGSCNMELPKDRQDFARWVACCIDKDAFFAIFHKPSARNMVIIEVNRNFSHFDHILGEHRWSEFLQEPTPEEKDRVTRVFYCTYNTGRIVQKNGWKRIDVVDAWFTAWSQNNRCIKYPYPTTHFCDVPVEDQTNHPLCRPLPGAVVTPPPETITAPQPIVGSAAWIQTKQGGPSPPPATVSGKPIGTWTKGAPKVRGASTKPNPTANGSAKKITNIPQGPLAGVRMPAVGGGPVSVKSSNVWINNQGSTNLPAPAVVNWDDSPGVSGRNSPAGLAMSPAASVNQASVAPPDLPARKNAWDEGTASYPLHPPGLPVPNRSPRPTSGSTPPVPDRATNSSITSCGSTGASNSSPDSESVPDLTPATESDNPYSVHVQFSECMEEEFHGMKIRERDDDSDLLELDSVAPGAWDETTWQTAPSVWDDAEQDAESLWRQGIEPEKPLLCNAHGVICKKGICAEYATQLRLAKRAKEAEERKEAAANKGKKGKGKRAAKRMAGVPPTGNAPQNNAAFRGPGAPVKTNWRGAPRAIVSADAIEKREAVKTQSVDGWGNSESDDEPSVAVVEAASAAGGEGNISVATSKRGGRGSKAPKSSASGWGTPNAAKSSASGWGAANTTQSGATNAAKSSTSGWGTVDDMPW